jgi:hypothetical protein
VARESSRVVARESSSVEAWESSSVEAWESSRVEARESSSVVARESSRVEAWGSSRVVARESSSVEAWESSSVEARESSRVEARESSSVVARESSSVVARESSRVVAWESSSVEARESSSVVARESSRVVARESSSVEAWESSSVEAWESSRVEARAISCVHQKSSVPTQVYGQASCYHHDGYAEPVSKSDRCFIIPVRRLTGNDGWLEENGIDPSDGYVVLFKRVSKDLLTQEGTENETSWPIGEMVTHANWNPITAECGRGKFHACSRPYFADEFRDTIGDRYIALKIAAADLHAWPNPEYPHKIAFRTGLVLHECDRWGDKI